MSWFERWRFADEPERILDFIEEGTKARESRLAVEQAQREADARQKLRDQYALLSSQQQADMAAQEATEAELVRQLTDIVRCLSELRAIEERASTDFQTLLTLSHDLHIEMRSPWQRTQVPRRLDVVVSDTLNLLRKR
jgi:hypothetical protein